MLKIGITGGIGSGKTTVCKIFELLDVPVYYADDASKELLLHDPFIKSKILTVFGEGVLGEDQFISRKKMAERVFENEKELNKLNEIMHPAVAKHFDNWLKKQEAFPYILKEAAIMFESNAYLQVDKVITVTAPVDIRVKRVMKRDGTKKEDILKRMNAQLSDEEKVKRSQFVIVNDNQKLVIPQVLALHSVFKNGL
ncbi:MAG TPA: dephospho-CoA kinase [Bacteroidia bacterium]|nr:dephospho-CoA kinase [Bacteroidia bacterium]